MFRDFSCISVLIVVGIVGCSSDAPNVAPPTTTVKGVLNMDGKPVPTAEVHFVPKGAPPTVLTVTNGTFSGSAPVGSNKVEVYIYAEEKGATKYQGTVGKKNIVPEKYWGANTALQANVVQGGANEFKFDITGK